MGGSLLWILEQVIKLITLSIVFWSAALLREGVSSWSQVKRIPGKEIRILLQDVDKKQKDILALMGILCIPLKHFGISTHKYLSFGSTPCNPHFCIDFTIILQRTVFSISSTTPYSYPSRFVGVSAESPYLSAQTRRPDQLNSNTCSLEALCSFS